MWYRCVQHDCWYKSAIICPPIRSLVGLQHGHYISLIKIHQQWLAFDDDVVMVRSVVLRCSVLCTQSRHSTAPSQPSPEISEPSRLCLKEGLAFCLFAWLQLVEEADVQAYFGTTCDGTADVAYILFYQRSDLDAGET
jgi:hypothetical protein